MAGAYLKVSSEAPRVRSRVTIAEIREDGLRTEDPMERARDGGKVQRGWSWASIGRYAPLGAA